jgi:5-hydroxyisourate hydrolase-like protein (transthyretin family)
MIKTGVIIMALVSLLNAGWFRNLFDFTPTPYYTMPIDLSKAGNVAETDIRIDKKYSVEILLDYYSYFRLSKDKKQGENRDKYIYITNKYFGRDKPLPVFPIKLTITKYEKNSTSVVVNKIYYTNSQTTTSSRLIDEFKLQNGKYHMKIETVENYQELEYLDVVVEIDYIRTK